MKSLFSFVVLFCIAVSCTSEKQDLHKIKLPINKYSINFVSRIKIKSEGKEVTLQVYALKNQDQDTIYVKTVKEPRFNTSLLKKLYECKINYRDIDRKEWYHTTSDNSGGYGSTDSVMLLPKQFMLFAKSDNVSHDTIQFDIKIKKRRKEKFEFLPVTKTLVVNSDNVYYDLEN